MTDYQAISAHALPHLPRLLHEMLPGGRIEGREYVTSDLSGGPGRSLSINLDSGVWKDFATGDGGGDPVSLFAAINCIAQSEAARKLSEAIGINGGRSHQQGKIVKTYDYLDAEGNLRFQVCRKEPKGFTQRKPDGKGGWVWSIKGVELVPYRLPDLIKSPYVYIVEGEQDADNLVAHGLPATCNPMGAGKWRSEYAPYFQGKRVCILTDNDDAGRRHAEQVARSLHGVAEVVKLLSLPDLPRKGDVTDWLRTGGTKEKLLELTRQAPDWEHPNDFSGQTHEIQPSVHAPSLQSEAIPAGIVHDVIRLATRESEADPVAVLTTFLVRFGAEVGSAPYYMVGDTRHAVRLNAAIVGDTSKARKGTSAGPVRTLFHGSSVTVTPGPLSSGEGIIYAVRDKVQTWKPDKEGSGGQWITTDPGVEDKRLMVLTEELAAAMKAMKREGNTASTTIRELWDRGDCAPLTKSNRICTTGAHVSIVGHITREELKTTMPEVEGFTGLGNRFLWVFARRQRLVAHPEPMPEAEVEAIRQRIFRLAEKARTVGRMNMTPAARDRWTAVYPELSADGYGLVGAITNRAEAQVIRLSMAYALLDESREIDLPHLTAALAFWDYCELSARYLFSGQASDPMQARILDGLARGPMTATEIYSGIFRRNVPSDKIQTALEELTQHGMIQVATAPTKGRPVTLYSISDAYAKNAFNAQSPEVEGVNAFNASNAYECAKQNQEWDSKGRATI